jgi:hypothetical protein
MDEGKRTEEFESMGVFSVTLLRGCSQFANLASTESNGDRIIELNAACVMFSAAYIEAMLNEELVLFATLENKFDVPTAYWESVIRLERDIRAKDKWNLIASPLGGTLWDSSREPFQFLEDMLALRNELVHYKGQFLNVGTAPTNRLSRFVERFKIKSHVTIGNAPEVSPWVLELLSNEELSRWISDRLRAFHRERISLLEGEA